MKNLLIIMISSFLLASLLTACQEEFEVEIPTVFESVIVDFEPDLNLIQTIPYHQEKQNADAAFISAKLDKNANDWILKYWSSEVQILEFVELDGYYYSHISEFVNDTLVVTFSDIEAIDQELTTYEQLIAVLNIEL